MTNQNRKDSWSGTLGKIPWQRLTTDISLELVAAGTGFVLSPSMPLAGSVLAENTITRVLEYMLRRFTHVYETGEVSLSEIFGRTIPEERYASVAEFWAKSMQSMISANALIEITGLLSPYGPMTPAHPMSRPGYTIEGWAAIGDLSADSTEEYDIRDSFIYGDRVIRLAKPRRNKYFAGLYDAYFGLANVSLPLYVDQALVKSTKHELSDLWTQPMAAGRIVKVKGRLRQISNYYAQFAGQLPADYCNLPSFGLEVFEIETSMPPNGITHISATVSWKKRSQEKMMAQYFNMQDSQQFSKAETMLNEVRNLHKNTMLFNYDDLACLSPQWRQKLPEYNEMIRPWLDGKVL
jgi:hypothetical protein